MEKVRKGAKKTKNLLMWILVFPIVLTIFIAIPLILVSNLVVPFLEFFGVNIDKDSGITMILTLVYVILTILGIIGAYSERNKES